jgi:hypothetical protein
MPRSRLANLLVALAVGALFLAALFAHGATAAVLLLVVAVFLGYLSWHAREAIPSRGRLARVVIVVVILVIAAAKLAAG